MDKSKDIKPVNKSVSNDQTFLKHGFQTDLGKKISLSFSRSEMYHVMEFVVLIARKIRQKFTLTFWWCSPFTASYQQDLRTHLQSNMFSSLALPSLSCYALFSFFLFIFFFLTSVWVYHFTVSALSSLTLSADQLTLCLFYDSDLWICPLVCLPVKDIEPLITSKTVCLHTIVIVNRNDK